MQAFYEFWGDEVYERDLFAYMYTCTCMQPAAVLNYTCDNVLNIDTLVENHNDVPLRPRREL